MSDLYHQQTIYTRANGSPMVLSVNNLGGGVGEVDCIECGGDGDWSKFHPEPETLMDYERNCVQCKGTGRQRIMFYPPKFSGDL